MIKLLNKDFLINQLQLKNVFLIDSISFILSHLVEFVEPQSLITPRWYCWIDFVFSNFIHFVFESSDLHNRRRYVRKLWHVALYANLHSIWCLKGRKWELIRIFFFNFGNYLDLKIKLMLRCTTQCHATTKPLEIKFKKNFYLANFDDFPPSSGSV